jgi:predicted transcriptional regulator
MVNPKKLNKVRIQLRIDKSVDKLIDELAAKEHRTRSAVIEVAMLAYAKAAEQRKAAAQE